MGLRTDMAADLPDTFEKLGEPAIFTPLNGTPIPDCHIFIDDDVDLQPDGFQATAWQRATIIRALLSEIVNEPNRGDIFNCADKDYTVQKVTYNDGLTVKMEVTP